MASKPHVKQTAYADPSARGVGWTHLSAATQRSDHGSARRTYKRSESATARANNRLPETSYMWEELVHFDDAHHVDELAPGISPSLVRWASPAGAIGEFALGGWLGWALEGGDNPLLHGFGYLGPTIATLGLGGVFAASGVLVGHGLGRGIGRFIGRADSTNLKPTTADLSDERLERGVVSKRRIGAHAALVATGAAGLGAYIYASSPRDVLFETASQPVNALPIAILGGLIPLGIGLVKAFWYSREAAVRHHELLAQFRRARARWSRLHSRASRRQADARARAVNVIAMAELADANQQTTTAERIATLIDERMELTPLLSADFPLAIDRPSRSAPLAPARVGSNGAKPRAAVPAP